MENKVLESKGNSSFDTGNYRDKMLVKAYHVIDLSDDTRVMYSDYSNKKGEYHEPATYVDCRIYTSKNYQTKYAIIWTAKGDGKGKAGGYGYDKDSASIGSAVRDAGYTLDKNISGVGEDAITGALVAIALYNGCKKPCIVRAFA